MMNVVGYRVEWGCCETKQVLTGYVYNAEEEKEEEECKWSYVEE